VGVNYPPIDGERETAAAVLQGIEDVGGEAVVVEGDVSDEESIRSMVNAFEAQLGPPDVLVNNAGILTKSRLDEMPVEVWDELLSVNLRGVFLVTRFVLPGMIERGSGTVINVASQLGFKGASGLVHYSTAKGGVIAFTRALAREVAPDITVNAIAPGPIDTDMTTGMGGDERRSMDHVPLERRGQVEDVVPTVLLLAGPGGDYYTGQTLSPDGGDAMH
jgi:3-oxoacyl-[acyl-carrier protein] reductase